MEAPREHCDPLAFRRLPTPKAAVNQDCIVSVRKRQDRDITEPLDRTSPLTIWPCRSRRRRTFEEPRTLVMERIGRRAHWPSRNEAYVHIQTPGTMQHLPAVQVVNIMMVISRSSTLCPISAQTSRWSSLSLLSAAPRGPTSQTAPQHQSARPSRPIPIPIPIPRLRLGGLLIRIRTGLPRPLRVAVFPPSATVFVTV